MLSRIDAQYVLKVADFGPSESTCTKDYIREQMTKDVKLPVKWMAPESISDGVFSEKTDVVIAVIALHESIVGCEKVIKTLNVNFHNI